MFLVDIIQNLRISDCLKFTQSFNRTNLTYAVKKKSRSVELDIVSFINSYYAGKCGIIYCLSKKECELMALNLSVFITLVNRHSCIFRQNISSRQVSTMQECLPRIDTRCRPCGPRILSK